MKSAGGVRIKIQRVNEVENSENIFQVSLAASAGAKTDFLDIIEWELRNSVSWVICYVWIYSSEFVFAALYAEGLKGSAIIACANIETTDKKCLHLLRTLRRRRK